MELVNKWVYVGAFDTEGGHNVYLKTKGKVSLFKFSLIW